MRIGNREFQLDTETYIMGILNVTPDSFSDGGKWNCLDAALTHAEEMIQEGADILDIGGESTRPEYTIVSEDEEICRVVPIIEEVTKRFDIPISIDTYKASVAKAALEAGADLVNDIWGLKYDKDMAGVIAKYKVSCCLMHNRSMAVYENFRSDVCSDLSKSIELALNAGISRELLMVDPGIGFAKSYDQNLELMNHLEDLHALGLPILLGTSRKSMIGLALNLPVNKRLEGTLVTTTMGVMKGCGIIRVHDVEANKRAVTMTKAILAK